MDLDRLLERRVSPRAAGIVRVVVGVAAALKAIEISTVLARFEDPSVLRVPYIEWLPSVADMPSLLVIAVWLVASLAFTLGVGVSIAGSALTLILAFVLASDQQLYSNHLYLLMLFVGLLTVARSGSAVSVWEPRQRSSVAEWPLLLIQLQVSIVYLFAGLSKVTPEFLSGTVIALALRRDGPIAVPADWRTFEAMAALSILAVILELFLAIALWIPRWRRTAFVVGFVMHAGITLWLEPPAQLAIFSLLILAPYLLFLRAPEREAAVVWDDSCGFCGTWIRLFRRLDWLHAIRDVPSSQVDELANLEVPREDADRALQLVRNGRRSQGFAAVVGVAELLPISFLWAPILRLPPIAWAGNRIYRKVAERRSCAVPARAEAS